jgi:capsular polysaccharide biosynthesis protein
MVAIRSATAALAGVCVVAACSSSSSHKPAPATPSTYHAEAAITVTTTGAGSSSAAHTIAGLATSPQVLRSVIADLQLHLSADELKAHISARAVGAGRVQIIAEDSDPTRAAKIANSDANAVYRIGPGVVSGAHLAIAQPASVPTN